MNISTEQKGHTGFNAHQLKLIAIVGMTLDHIGYVFGNYMGLVPETALYALGGLTFPIMAFLLTEGYRYTSNVKRYMLRLLAFAAISFLPFAWATHMPILNVMFTLLLGVVGLYLNDHMKNRVAFWFVFVGMTLVTLMMDWALMGVPMVLLYHRRKGRYNRFVTPVLIPIGMMGAQFLVGLSDPVDPLAGLPSLAFALIGCSLTVPLLMRYNGRQYGNKKPFRYLFYVYYPAHLLVLALLRGAMFGDWFLF
jgi:hypothetical protein